MLGISSSLLAVADEDNHVSRMIKSKSCEGCDLSGATLSNSSLRKLAAAGANFTKAYLVGADLQNSTFQGRISRVRT